jgi:hypothetical protein
VSISVCLRSSLCLSSGPLNVPAAFIQHVSPRRRRHLPAAQPSVPHAHGNHRPGILPHAVAPPPAPARFKRSYLSTCCAACVCGARADAGPTEFQLLHTPDAFRMERIAWRLVIYLNLVRSVRRYVLSPLVTGRTKLRVQDPRRDRARTTGGGADCRRAAQQHARAHVRPRHLRGPAAAAARRRRRAPCTPRAAPRARGRPRPRAREPGRRRPRAGRARARAGADRARSAPALARVGLGRAEPELGLEQAHRGHGPQHGLHAEPHHARRGRAAPLRVPAAAGARRARRERGAARAAVAGGDGRVLAQSKWRTAFSLGGRLRAQSPKDAHTNEIEGWWEDPEDPVHALHAAAGAIGRLWRDEAVRARLKERRVPLEESSGLYVRAVSRMTRALTHRRAAF